MSGAIDREWVLADVAPEAPCGLDLEYEPAVIELDELMKGRPMQQLGEVLVPPEDPDWQEVRAKATGLLERTKDLRILVNLSRALPHTDGWASFAQCLAVIGELLRERWQDLHPQLDEEDRRDPRHRANVLSQLADPRVLEQFGRVPLLGTVAGFPCLNEVRWARGEFRDEWWADGLDSGSIEQALSTCSPADREAARRDLRQAQSEVWGICRVFFERSEGVRELPLTDLLRLLLQAERTLG